MNRDDLVHIQWEGSNSNPKSEGEGRQGTDRSNIVPITVAGASIPAGTPSFPNNELELDYFKYKTKEGTTRAFKSLIIKDSTLPEIVQQCEAAKMIPDLSEIKISHSCEHSFQGKQEVTYLIFMMIFRRQQSIYHLRGRRDPRDP